MAEWQLAHTSLAGANRAFIEGLGLKITRRLNGGMTMTFNVEAQDSRLADISLGDGAFKAYRDSVLRFHGRVWEPVSWTPEAVDVVCEDPWAHIENRRVYTSDDAPRVYTSTDAGAIAWDLILQAKTDPVTAGGTPIRIRQGATATSVPHDRTYEVGKPIGEAIRQLAAVENGFWFRVDPVDDVAGVQGELVVLYPTSGTTRDAASFEYGDETRATLTSFKLVQLLPRNQIRARGSLGDLSLLTVVQDTASIAAYDMIEDEVSFLSVADAAILTAHATDALQGEPREVYELTPTPGGGLMLWDDFDVGDIISFYIKHGSLLKSGTARVTEAEVTVTDGGTEILSRVTIEAV